MKILVTGGCGFIGINFINYFIEKHSDCEILNIDAMKYTANPKNHNDLLSNPRYKFYNLNLLNANLNMFIPDDIDYAVHFAADTKLNSNKTVDLIENNVIATAKLIEALRNKKIKKFIQVSTCDVYSQCSLQNEFYESAPVNPRMYVSSKAASDTIALSFYKTYGFPVIIARCTNSFGPYQYPEKLIPMAIMNAIYNIPVKVCKNENYTRDWIYISDHISAIEKIIEAGIPGEIYNISSEKSISDIEIARKVFLSLNKDFSLIQPVDNKSDEDFSYSVDSSKLKHKGWKCCTSFDEGLQKTVEWYVKNKCYWM